MTGTLQAEEVVPFERGVTDRQDLSAEMAVLGAMMEAGGQYADVPSQIINILSGPSDFYHPKHGMIYRKITTLIERGEQPTIHSVLASLDAQELGKLKNGAYLIECVGAGSPAQGTYFAKIVRQYAAKRDGIEIATRHLQLMSSVPPDSVGDVFLRMQEDTRNLRVGGNQTALVSHDDTAEDVLTYLEETAARVGQPPNGALTGWEDLDYLFNGLTEGQVIVIAGRPGMGKSTAARQIAMNVSMRQKLPALFFSLEMSRVEVGLCVISAGAGVPLASLRSGVLSDEDWTRIARYMEATAGSPLYYDETPGADLAHIEAGMRQQLADHGKLGVVVIDYLGLVPTKGKGVNRQEIVSEISRGAKLLAKKYQVPIILVAQLNRGPEQRPDKRPQLSDLRESGSIEQDADIVILVHRDDYYDKESPRAGEADFIVAKHRNGPTDTVTLAAQLHLSRFVSMAIG